nr:MMPL family transporter [Curtobacterium sp. 314Chir4.1]
MLKSNYDDTFTLPGSQSQAGQDLLAQRFSTSGGGGSTGQVVMSVQSGRIDTSDAKAEVESITKAIDGLPDVTMTDPLTFDSPVVSKDGRAVLGQVMFADQKPSQSLLDKVVDTADSAATEDVDVTVGGAPYSSDTAKTSKLPELLGLILAFLILLVTFGSFLAAGMPLVTAIVGVAVTLCGVIVASHFGRISSTSPTLAEMLGLAVGIDYALFLLSRHRSELATGLDPVEAMARALATAGSAVVFAGATVVIALCGLSITGIPILTVMGLTAAGAVAIAVLIALTLVPAIALTFGTRLRPRAKRRQRRGRGTQPAKAPAMPPTKQAAPSGGLSRIWLRLVTRRPLITVVVVTVGLAVMSVPAFSIALALPDSSTASVSTPAGKTYQKIATEFGAGYTAPLSVAANIISSDDPKQTVSDLADDIKQIDGVEAVTQATPNESADTALIQVIPEGGQSDPTTAALVNRIRADASALEKKAGVTDILVAGTTAVTLDVSAKLATALVPFGAVVIGLSLVLLMIVFRSIAVPLKATFGYLLSVGSALGAVVAVFQWGWLGPGLETGTGTVVSFLPIFIMGVLFGLAMDYEMFLVSRMREDFIRTRDARASVLTGFAASAKVVSAAALIMGCVFLAFVPNGSATIQPIALGLAIGVFVDAFLVRMTLVPAVLQLLGAQAWWLPAWLDRVLPTVDVEGAALERYVRYLEWRDRNGADAAIWAHGLRLHDTPFDIDLVVPCGAVAGVVVRDAHVERSLAYVLTGRGRFAGGDMVINGQLLPERRSAVARSSAVVNLGDNVSVGAFNSREAALREVRHRVDGLTWSRRSRQRIVAQTFDLLDTLSEGRDDDGHEIGSADLDVAIAAAAGAAVIVLFGATPADHAEAMDRAAQLAQGTAEHGAAVVLLGADLRAAVDRSVPVAELAGPRAPTPLPLLDVAPLTAEAALTSKDAR